MVISILSSCMGVRYLQDDEYLLRRQRITGNKEISTEYLEVLYQQKPNKKLPLLPVAPYVWIYHMGKKGHKPQKIENKITKTEEKYNRKISKNADNPDKVAKLERIKTKKIDKKRKSLKEGNFLMRWGEPVSVYDKETAERTKNQLQLYLRTKGYFHSTVEQETKTSGRRIKVTYKISENRPHIIDTVYYSTDDSTIYRLIDQNIEDSKIEAGDNYDQDNLTLERERIEKLLKDHGYFDFSRQYIVYKIDTTIRPYEAAINMVINNPAKRGYHKAFVIDSVIFVTDASVKYPPDMKRQNFPYRGITYQFYQKRFSKKVLNQRVFINKDSLYSMQKTLDTQRQLANLDNFKFININYDTTGGRFIANIFTSPLQKYQTVNEIGLTVTEGYPGPFYNLSFKNRNIFGGLENLEVNGYFGFEGVAGVTTDDVYSSLEAGGKMSIIFPQFVIPASAKYKRKVGNLNPMTTLRSGFSVTQRPEYTRNNFNSAIVYNWQKERRRFYNLTLSEISLINSTTDSAFNALLTELENQGNPLKKSFNPSLVTSSSFYVMYNFNPDDLYGNKSSLLKLFVESGGFLYNFVDPKQFNDALEYYQFLKFSADFRRYISLGETKGIASHLNLGIAYAYGENKSLPYEKFFFAGGSSSIRAWHPRRLGPGSQKPSLNENPDKDGLYDYSIEKPGEIIIEANLEYRSKLIGFLDWAFFIDAGNVWNIRESQIEALKGSDFKFDRFYKEIAIGTGLGLRLNFSFLIIRFDYGIKIYDPARDEGERWLLKNLSLTNWRGEPGQALWNIAIGYPF